MVLANSYYSISKIEIKPQLNMLCYIVKLHYSISKIEIKPQRLNVQSILLHHYSISKIEIKPQPCTDVTFRYLIILYQKLKSNHNHSDTI